MAQQFYQPKRSIRRDDDSEPDNTTPGAYSSRSAEVSADAAKTLNNIDDVLAENGGLADKEKQATTERTAEEGPSSLNDAENATNGSRDTSDRLGRGYNPVAKKGMSQRIRGSLSGNKRKALLGGGIGIGIVGFIIAAFLYILPLKIVSITQNLQDKFFATSEQATQREVDRLVQSYISKKVLPGMFAGNCKSTLVNYKCVAVSSSTTTPIGRLYNGWRDAKLETALAQKYGLEIVRNGDTIYIRSDSLQREIFRGEYRLGGNNTSFDNKMFTAMTRGEARVQVEKAIQGETYWKQWYYKVKVKGLLSRKYGVARCVTACATLDKIADSTAAKKLAFKSYLNKLVVEPHNEILSLAIDCAASGFNCAEPDSWSEDGEKTSQFTRDVQEKLVTFRDTATPESLEELKAKSERIQKEGFVKTAIVEILTKIGVKNATRVVDLADPIGWIDLLTHVAAAAKSAPQAIRYMRYASQAAVSVGTFNLFRTTADEIKTGKIDPGVVGTFATALNDAANGGGTDQGGQAAEQAPIYQLLSTGKQVTNQHYKCDNGDPIPGDAQVCSEEQVGQAPSQLDNWRDMSYKLTSYIPQVQQAEQFITAWNWVSDHLFDIIGKGITWLIKATPPGAAAYDFFVQHFAEMTQGALKWLGDAIAPSPITDSPSGGRLMTVMAAGADQSASQFAHYGIGGQLLSDQQVAEARNQQRADQIAALQDEPLVNRIFDTQNSQSVVAKMAIATPTSFSDAIRTSFASIFSAPGHLVSSIFGINNVFADNTPQSDPFLIPQYGYDKNDPVFNTDPEKYWKALNCDSSETAINWGKSGTLNPSTGENDNTTTNGCALIQAAIGSSGAQFTSSVLTENDMNLLIPDPGTSETLPGDPTSPNPSAQAVLDSCKNGSATGKVKIVCSSLTLLGLPYADPSHPFTKYLDVSNQPRSVGCNAFVDISILRATKGVYRKEYCSQQFASEGVRDGNFKKIPLRDIQPGDIVVRESSCGCTSSCANGHDNLGRYGHVAVVVSYDASTDKIVVAEASSKRRPSGVRDPTTATWSSSNIYGFTFGMQYTGGGL